VGAKRKGEALGEGGHLRRRHHPGPRAGGDDDVRVVDHADRGRRAKIRERVRQKHLAIEAGEGRIGLEEEHARVTQHE
jgi:hypothetical protein